MLEQTIFLARARHWMTAWESKDKFVKIGGGAFFAAGGATQFFDNSSASHGTFIIDCAAASGGLGALIQFFNSSTAANGTFTTNGGSLSGKGGGGLEFHDGSTADKGSFTTNGITADLAGPAYTQSSTARPRPMGPSSQMEVEPTAQLVVVSQPSSAARPRARPTSQPTAPR
jgi:hypothetical protein